MAKKEISESVNFITKEVENLAYRINKLLSEVSILKAEVKTLKDKNEQ